MITFDIGIYNLCSSCHYRTFSNAYTYVLVRLKLLCNINFFTHFSFFFSWYNTYLINYISSFNFLNIILFFNFLLNYNLYCKYFINVLKLACVVIAENWKILIDKKYFSNLLKIKRENMELIIFLIILF